MSIYDVSGNGLNSAYGKTGAALSNAYDIEGTEIFPDEPPVIPMTVMTFNVGSFYTEWHPAPSSTGDVFYLRNKGIFEQYNLLFAGMSEWYNEIGTVAASVLMDEFFGAYYPNYTPYPNSANHALTSGFYSAASNVTLTKYTNQGSENRYFQKGYITVDGKTICCILTHLDLNSSARALQFQELMTAVANETYFIITGDFNFTIQSVGDSEYNNSIKVALDLGYHSAQNENSLINTWYGGQTAEGSSSKYPLDNIITSANIDITNVRVDTTKLTDGLCEQYEIIIDHLPLIAELTIN